MGMSRQVLRQFCCDGPALTPARMRLFVLVFAVLALWLGQVTPAAAQAPVGQVGARFADATQSEASLMPLASFVRDATESLTALDALALVRDGKAASVQQDVFSPGYSMAAYWFVVSLENSGIEPLKRLLVINPTWMDHLQITLIDSNGNTQQFTGGDSVPFSQRAEEFRRPNFSLMVPSGSSTLVVRAATRDPFYIGMELMDQKSFEQLAAFEALYFGLLYGGLLSLLLFNLVLFLNAREKTYLMYCFWLTAFLTAHTSYNGHVFRWLLPEFPELQNWEISVSVYAYCFFGFVFALTFLELKTKLPNVYAWTMRLLFLMGLTFFVSMLGGYRAHVISAVAWIFIFSLSAFTLGLLSLRRRNNAAFIYLSASTAGLLGSSISSLTVMSVLPYTELTFRAVDIGILIDAIMLSLALSARIGEARRLERLRRFFSPAVAEKLLSATSEELYQPRQREVVVVFLDLRGYTAFTEKYGAEEVMRILGEFHAAMGKLITVHEATLERFAGDGMMIFFNDPVEIPDPASRAVTMAVQMQDDFLRLNEVWAQRGYSLAMGIGVAQGIATIGAIGFEGRRDYAAIGNVTNLAARLCAEAKPGQILVSNVVADQIEESVPVQSIGLLTLKGFSEPVACYEIAQRPQSKRIEAIALAVSVPT